MKENEKEFIIKAERKIGVAKEDIEATVSNDSVTIEGEKKEEKEDKNKNYYYMERSYGSFHRMIPLATEVESSKAEGRFKNGVIDIKLPKSQNAQTRVKIPDKNRLNYVLPLIKGQENKLIISFVVSDYIQMQGGNIFHIQ